MEYIIFSSFVEDDFDEIITNCGGKRYTNDPSIKELNCDYIIDDTVIELKIIEEEPLEKKEKQKKFIELFPANAETVILYPTEEQKYQYYKILQSPIQKALKKASKQLQHSAKTINAKLRIAILMNNGLYMVSQKEFTKIAINRAKNDTSGIDILIICSIYYYSDKFDMKILTEFKDYKINEINYNKDKIINKLRKEWNKKIKSYIANQMIDLNIKRNKEPIKDIFFDYNGIRYIKPHPQWGEKSEFWKNGRPREDTTKEDDLPLISVVPIFNEEVYLYLKNTMIDNYILKNSLNEYFKTINESIKQLNNKIQIMVYMELFFDDLKVLKEPFNPNDIQQLANIKYETLFKKIQNEMTEYKGNLECDDFILVEIHEIGIDKANDIAFISHITNNIKQEYLIDGIRLKYKYAITLAITLCIALRSKKVYFIRNEDYKWK